MKESQSYLDKYGRFNASQAWQEGKAPIVRLVTDAEKVVGMMFAYITLGEGSGFRRVFHGSSELLGQ